MLQDEGGRDAVGVEEKGNGKGVSPSPADWSLGERRELPNGVWGRAPAENDYSGF